MIRIGGVPHGIPGEDTQFRGLYYPDGDCITRHMVERLENEPFYQHDKLADALKRVKRRRRAVDCGAWVGGWSRELARHFDVVDAIEANPDNFRCIARNVPDNVSVWNMAVSDRSGGQLRVGSDGSGVGTDVRPHGIVTVPMMSLDDFLGQEADAVDYLKIHVNGMELKALRGAEQTIRGHRPVLTIVLKPALAEFGDTPDEARDLLSQWGYRPDGGERPYEIFVPR